MRILYGKLEKTAGLAAAFVHAKQRIAARAVTADWPAGRFARIRITIATLYPPGRNAPVLQSVNSDGGTQGASRQAYWKRYNSISANSDTNGIPFSASASTASKTPGKLY